MSKSEKEKKEEKQESALEKFFRFRKQLGWLILIFKIAVILSFIGIVATFTIEHTLFPYYYFTVSLEISAGLLIGILSFKMNTYRPREMPECPIHILNAREEAKFLWTNLSSDINQYEQAASYYFNGVRTYKYSTILLAGISTVVLGLDFGKDLSMEFAVFAKNTALVIGAVIAVSTSLFTFWNIEKYWLINKTIANKLKAQRHELETASAKGSLLKTATPDEKSRKAIDDLIQKYTETKETFYKYWEGALSERNSQNTQK